MKKQYVILLVIFVFAQINQTNAGETYKKGIIMQPGMEKTTTAKQPPTGCISIDWNPASSRQPRKWW